MILRSGCTLSLTLLLLLFSANHCQRSDLLQNRLYSRIVGPEALWLKNEAEGQSELEVAAQSVSLPHGWPTTIASRRPEAADPVAFARQQDRIRRFMAYYHGEELFPSFAVGVFDSEGFLFTHTIQSSIDRRYGTGSVTKLITATLFQLLVARGQLDPSANIDDFFPGLRALRLSDDQPMTLQHLVSHTSGLPDLRYYDGRSSQHIEELGLEVIRPIYPPGYHYRYSNQGYIILGHILEQICEESVEECAQREIFVPLGMESSGGPSSGAAGFSTTLRDLMEFGRLYLNKGVVANQTIMPSESIEEMMYAGFAIPRSDHNFFTGRGWRVRRNPDGVVTIFHIGGANHISAWLQLFPPYNIGICYLGNPPAYSDRVMGYLVGVQTILGDIATAYVGAPEPVYRWRPDRPADGVLAQYPGRYRNILTDDVLRVELDSNPKEYQLMLHYRGRYRLQPETHQNFNGGRGLSQQFVIDRHSREVIGVANAHGYFEKLEGEGENDKE